VLASFPGDKNHLVSRRRRRGLDASDIFRGVLGLVLLLAVAFGVPSMLHFKSVADVAAFIVPLILAAGIITLLGIVGWELWKRRLRNARNTSAQPVQAAIAAPASRAHSKANFQPLRRVSRLLARPSSTTEFNWDVLRALEWRVFEQLVQRYFRTLGFEAERKRVGADGGVDLVLRKAGETEPFAYVQCKAWNTYLVGVKPVRELFGVMAADGVRKGYFVCTGAYTPEAIAFAEGKPLKLVTGEELLEKLNGLDSELRTCLLGEVLSGDYTTPTCPRCDTKMVRREGKDGGVFWGCTSFPKCWQRFPISDS
jgi:restriction system protein